jgi:glycosyltransferase involved in cell wall biosynthesis
MNEVSRAVLAQHDQLTWFNPSGSTEIHDVGRMSLRKMLVGLRSVARFAGATARRRGHFVGYVSPARGGMALYRDTAVWLLSVVLGERTIVHVHTGEFGFLRSIGPLGRIQRRLLRHSDVWAQTEQWAKEIEGLGARRTSIVPNGVHCPEDHLGWTVDTARSRAPDRLHVVFVGNIAVAKGIDVFLEVVDDLLRRGSVRVTVAGSTFDLETDKLVDDFVAGHPDAAVRVHHLDTASRCALLRSADILVFPSRYKEAPSLVVCEAMEHGVIPLVSDRGALPELVDGAGYVCTEVSDYRDVLLRLRDDEELRRARSLACHRRWRSDYSLERYSERILQAMEECPT